MTQATPLSSLDAKEKELLQVVEGTFYSHVDTDVILHQFLTTSMLCSGIENVTGEIRVTARQIDDTIQLIAKIKTKNKNWKFLTRQLEQLRDKEKQLRDKEKTQEQPLPRT